MINAARHRYPGLEPFRTEQRAQYFGRAMEVEQLTQLVWTHQQVLVYAKSGLGKSSLLNAGLVPRLQARPEAVILPVRLGAWVQGQSLPPTKAIAGALEGVAGTLLDKLIPQEDSLWYRFKAHALSCQAPPTYYIILDQFEELFTHPEEDIFAFKKQMADLLYRAVPQRWRAVLEIKQREHPQMLGPVDLERFFAPMDIKVIYAIREDRYYELNRLADHLPDLLHHRFELAPLDRKRALDAIVEPARLQGDYISPPFSYSTEALNLILDYLAGGQHVETTQLQVLCSHFERLGKSVVGVEDVPAFDDIFLQFYLECIEALEPTERLRARRFIEEYMIIDSKRIGYHRLACQEHMNDQTLDTLLSERHLLRAERGSTGETLELSHDTLVAPVLIARDRRLAEEQAQAEEDAREVERTKKAAAEEREREERARVEEENRRLQVLVDEKEQARALEAFARKKEEEARAKEAEAQVSLRRQLRRARIFLTCAVLAVLVAFYAVMDARKQRDVAEQRRLEAEKQETIASQKTIELEDEKAKTDAALKRERDRQINHLLEKYSIVKPLDSASARYLADSMWVIDSQRTEVRDLHKYHYPE